MSKYAKDIDKKELLETLCEDENRKNFMFGFMSCLTFAYYRTLNQEQKDLWCGETFETIVETFGKEHFEEFLKEYEIRV